MYRRLIEQKCEKCDAITKTTSLGCNLSSLEMRNGRKTNNKKLKIAIGLLEKADSKTA
jgi:hypothetical protein